MSTKTRDIKDKRAPLPPAHAGLLAISYPAQCVYCPCKPCGVLKNPREHQTHMRVVHPG